MSCSKIDKRSTSSCHTMIITIIIDALQLAVSGWPADPRIEQERTSGEKRPIVPSLEHRSEAYSAIEFRLLRRPHVLDALTSIVYAMCTRVQGEGSGWQPFESTKLCLLFSTTSCRPRRLPRPSPVTTRSPHHTATSVRKSNKYRLCRERSNTNTLGLSPQ